MAFVASRKEVGYFGYLCDQKLLLFHSPFSEFCGLPNEDPVVLPSFVDDGGSTNQSEKPADAEVQPRKEHNRPGLNSAAISNCGSFIAISDDKKQLQLWKRCEDQWTLLSTRTLPRKCLQVLFTNSGSEIIAADRGGDIYSSSVSEANECCKLILGHVCAILSVEMTEDDAYIITCDRDAKIRVSCYPNAYNIESYCLGHREFVSALKLYSNAERLLLSGSGDGTVKLWKCDEGEEVFSCDLTKDQSLFVNKEAVNEAVDNHTSKPLLSTAASQDQSSTSVIGDTDPQFKKQVAVKCIAYCPEAQVFALLFYSHPCVAICQMNSGKSLEFIQYLNLESVPLDAYFDSAGCLWLLLSSRDNSVAIFKSTICDNSVKFVKLEETDSSKVEKICLEIRNNWRVFPLSIDVSNLYKPDYIRGWGKQSPIKEKSFQPKNKRNKVK